MKEHSLFDLLVLSLGNAVLISLGQVSEPGSTSLKKDLESARYNIELLEMLREKTAGNLSQDEGELLNSLTLDLKKKLAEG